jgi:hypothetical protein
MGLYDENGHSAPADGQVRTYENNAFVSALGSYHRGDIYDQSSTEGRITNASNANPD